MMEIKELVKISLVSGLLNLETIQFGQFLISRPSFSAFILGLITGHPLECFLAGVLIEAIYLDFTPIGGVVPPNGYSPAQCLLIYLILPNLFQYVFSWQ